MRRNSCRNILDEANRDRERLVLQRNEKGDMQRRPSLEQKKRGGAGGGEML